MVRHSCIACKYKSKSIYEHPCRVCITQTGDGCWEPKEAEEVMVNG